MASTDRGNGTGSAGGFVLVVDSEPKELIFTSMLVQRLGYHACSALGVGNALEIATASAPAAIVAELNLKGLGGIDLLDLLKDKPGRSAVPIVIMTRELTPEVDRQCRAAGAAACLEKPVKVHELYRVIHPLIDPGTRRRDVRIDTSLSVIVDERTLDCVEGECATNLSVCGMHLRTRTAYPENGHVRVRVKINEEYVEAESRVAYCRRDEHPGMWNVGLQFLRTSPESGEIIRRFINDVVTHGMDAPDEEKDR